MQLDRGSGAAWIGILNEDGLRALRRGGHAALARACAPGLPPESVRFVDPAHRPALDSAQDAGALFDSAFPELPHVVSAAHGAPLELEIRIQPDLACLRGHFPAIPIVPGAVQVGWALAFAAARLGSPPLCRSLRAVKFERIIQPGHRLRLRIDGARDSSILRFQYESDRGRHSQGRIGAGRFDE